MKLSIVLMLASALSFTTQVFAQCDTFTVPISQVSVLYAAHADASSAATNAIDSNNNTYWRTAAGTTFPHEIWLNLGAVRNLIGVGYKPRNANTAAGKIKQFEAIIGFSDTSTTYAATGGYITYANNNDNGIKKRFFGITPGDLVKLTAYTSLSANDEYIDIAELEFYYTTCPNTGKLNQVIRWNEITKKTTDDAPVPLTATLSNGFTPSYRVVSGPASIVGTDLVLSGTPGTVKVAAFKSGDATYWPADTIFQTFEVIELNNYNPAMTVRLTDAVPIEMPTLSTYPISAFASIAEPDFLWIEDFEVTIAGETIDTIFRDGAGYTAHWTPSAYGNYTVQVTARANNGKDTTATLNVTVANQASNQTVTAMNNVLVSFGQSSRTMTTEIALPQFVGAYDSIHALLDITCPTSGGCDPYDRAAWIEAKDPSGNWVQIIRYITPFGVACNHDIDLTEYAWLLQGNTPLRIFVDTWAGGWVATLNLQYFTGTPPYKYTRITEIWDGDYPFGNPANLQPVDTVTHRFFANTQAATFTLSNTGHGWGDNNTGNAAEFYRPNHTVKIGTDTYAQDLWNLCNPNPDGCQPQNGTWTFDRAGWCPGAISPPDKYNLAAALAADTNVTLQYIFQESYIDQCHPQNPNCISGTTCPNCSGDIQPHYYVDGHLVEYSNTPFIPKQPEPDTTDTTTAISPASSAAFNVNLYPNPATSNFQLAMDLNTQQPIMVLIHDISGKQFGGYYFHNTRQLSQQTFSAEHLSPGMYFVTISSGEWQAYKKLVIE